MVEREAVAFTKVPVAVWTQEREVCPLVTERTVLVDGVAFLPGDPPEYIRDLLKEPHTQYCTVRQGKTIAGFSGWIKTGPDGYYGEDNDGAGFILQAASGIRYARPVPRG
jgi:hypothetical protein